MVTRHPWQKELLGSISNNFNSASTDKKLVSISQSPPSRRNIALTLILKSTECLNLREMLSKFLLPDLLGTVLLERATQVKRLPPLHFFRTGQIEANPGDLAHDY
jgi:hypothetical protein